MARTNSECVSFPPFARPEKGEPNAGTIKFHSPNYLFRMSEEISSPSKSGDYQLHPPVKPTAKYDTHDKACPCPIELSNRMARCNVHVCLELLLSVRGLRQRCHKESEARQGPFPCKSSQHGQAWRGFPVCEL